MWIYSYIYGIKRLQKTGWRIRICHLYIKSDPFWTFCEYRRGYIAESYGCQNILDFLPQLNCSQVFCFGHKIFSLVKGIIYWIKAALNLSKRTSSGNFSYPKTSSGNFSETVINLRGGRGLNSAPGILFLLQFFN